MPCRRRSTVGAASSTLVLAGLFAIALVRQIWAQPQTQQVQEGKALFQQKCAPCHTIGGGPLVGPDLQGISSLRPRDWLLHWITAPDRVLAEGDPTATELLHQWNDVPMPNQGLSQAQVEAVVAYLETTTPVTATPPVNTAVAPAAAHTPRATPSPPSGPVTGDLRRGGRLFTGRTHLQNGGPPCIACHQVAGLRTFGGGNLGPDLTLAFQKYGGATGLTSVLANIAFPTMLPVFADHALTDQDQADLVTFLQTEAQRQPQPAAVPPGLVAGGGTLLLLGLIPVVWRRHLHGVRRSVVSGANKPRDRRVGTQKGEGR